MRNGERDGVKRGQMVSDRLRSSDEIIVEERRVVQLGNARSVPPFRNWRLGVMTRARQLRQLRRGIYTAREFYSLCR